MIIFATSYYIVIILHQFGCFDLIYLNVFGRHWTSLHRVGSILLVSWWTPPRIWAVCPAAPLTRTWWYWRTWLSLMNHSSMWIFFKWCMPIRSKKCGTFCLTLLHPVTTFYKTNISYLPYMSFFQGRMVPLCLLTMDDIYLEKKLFFWWDVRFTGWICPRTPPKFLGMQLNSRWWWWNGISCVCKSFTNNI